MSVLKFGSFNKNRIIIVLEFDILDRIVILEIEGENRNKLYF